MDRQQFEELPTSTNAVESYNRFGKHRQPLKVAMMATYKEDMAKTWPEDRVSQPAMIISQLVHVPSVHPNKIVPARNVSEVRMMILKDPQIQRESFFQVAIFV